MSRVIGLAAVQMAPIAWDPARSVAKIGRFWVLSV